MAFHPRRGVLKTLIIVNRRRHFLLFQELFKYFDFFFSDSLSFFERILMLSSSRDQIVAVCLISKCVAPRKVFFDLGIWYNENPISQYHRDCFYILVIFFQILFTAMKDFPCFPVAETNLVDSDRC